MKLYHGSNQKVEKPIADYSTRFKMDFGRGFYTTTSEEQARSFTNGVMIRNKNQGTKTVSIYRLDIAAFKDLNVKDFDGATAEWFDYVEKNRRSEVIVELDYDIIMGPVADDKINRTFTLYETKVISREQALKDLKTEIYKDQIVFKTQKSLEYLEYLGFVEVD